MIDYLIAHDVIDITRVWSNSKWRGFLKFDSIRKRLECRKCRKANSIFKTIDEGLKKEMKKNQLGMLDSGGMRRELTSEIEKQKSELEAIKRMEVDQIRKKCEI